MYKKINSFRIKLRLIFFPVENFLTMSYIIDDDVVVFPCSKTSISFIWWMNIKSRSVAVIVSWELLASNKIFDKSDIEYRDGDNT